MIHAQSMSSTASRIRAAMALKQQRERRRGAQYGHGSDRMGHFLVGPTRAESGSHRALHGRLGLDAGCGKHVNVRFPLWA